MQEDQAVRKPSWLETRAPALTGIAALAAAAFYFVGWQYKQSLAMNFGLASYPGDLSFQGTVATGVATILDGPVMGYIGVFMTVVWLILQGLAKIPTLLMASVNVSRREKLKAKRAFRVFKKRHANNEKIAEHEMLKLEKDIDRMLARHDRRSFLINAIRRSVLPLIFLTLGSFIVVVFSLFYAGHFVAMSEAREIRTQATGKCQGCYIYDVKPSALTGIPLFQSTDTIFIQSRSGFARVPINKINGIRPYGRASNTPSKIPRL